MRFERKQFSGVSLSDNWRIYSNYSVSVGDEYEDLCADIDEYIEPEIR